MALTFQAGKKTTSVVAGKKSKYLWLQTRLPNQLAPRSSLYLPTVIEVFELYVGAELIHSFGDINLDDPTASHGHPWHIIQLRPEWQSLPLTFKIASPTQRIGISSGTSRFTVSIGESEEILASLLKENFSPFLIGLAVSCAGLFLIFAGIVMREATFSFLGLFALSLGTYVFTLSKLQFLLINTPVAWGYINIYSVFIAPLAFIAFVTRIFPESKKLLRWFLYLHLIVASASTLLVITDTLHIRKCQSVFNLLLIATFLSILYATVRKTYKKDVNSSIFSLGYLFLLVFSVMDILVGLGFTGLPILTHWGILIFLLCVMTIGFRQFLRGREKRIYLSRSIADAKAVQQTLIPKNLQIPQLAIAAFYQSAGETGGDWYDVYYDSNSQTAYIFVADVAGHGMPAALVTGVICGSAKALIAKLCLEERSPSDNLCELAQGINQSILATGSRTGRIATMSLFAIELDSGCLHSVNAGHPFVHVVSADQVRPIVSQGSPLGLKQNPTYRSTTTILEAGDRIFIYTDGLVENQGPTGIALSQRSLIRELPTLGQHPEAIKASILERGSLVWQNTSPADDCTFVVLEWQGPDCSRLPKSS